MNNFKIILLFIFLSLSFLSFAQKLKWTDKEKMFYSKTKELCIYLKNNSYDPSKRNFLFDNYIYFVNPKNDTTQDRLDYFDGLFYRFFHFVDSVGLDNLDAKPVRYFKSDQVFYQRFQEGLKWADSLSLAYFDKRNPKRPLGSLLYDTVSGKLISWIVLNMGGFLYLTPNLY